MKRLIHAMIIAIVFISSTAYAISHNDDYRLFHKLFSDWSNAFNRKDLPVACALFSRSVTADYKGAPRKNYASICNSFKRVFSDPDRTYTYHFKLHHVYRSGNLAAARITWYFQIEEVGKPTSNTIDQGIDVLQLNKNGQWQIIDYLAYES